MKKNKVLGICIVGILLVSSKASVVNAEELLGQSKETQIRIVITGDNNGLVSKDNKKTLSLDRVPGKYNFKSILEDEEYKLDASLNDTEVEVFNNYTTSDWAVKAELKDDELTLMCNESEIFKVNSFRVNDKEILKVGSDGLIAKSINNKKIRNKAYINKMSMSFLDIKDILKENDTLNGLINYQLYNVPKII